MNASLQKLFIQTFMMFLMRDNGFSLEQADAEIKVLKKYGISKFYHDGKSYLYVSRIGALKQLNRKERIPVMHSLSSAFNHAQTQLEEIRKSI